MKKLTIISILVFLVDRFIKIFISSNFDLNIRNKIIDGFFYITNCHNKGAAFSLFSGNLILLILITLVVLFLIFYFLRKNKNMSNLTIISYGILLGGIFGNLFDRLFYGYVIDYLDFIIFNFDFAIFNLADVCILTGAVLLLLFEGSEKGGRKNNN